MHIVPSTEQVVWVDYIINALEQEIKFCSDLIQVF